jgi:hypothetical protein
VGTHSKVPAVWQLFHSDKVREPVASRRAKSVTRQLAHATAYASRKGWTVRDEHVYVDDWILRAELAGCAAPAPIIDRNLLERRLHTKLADWRGLLTRNLTTGRDVLRLLLAGPIGFTPVNEDRRRGYRFEAAIALDRMIGGVLETYSNGTSPEGFEPSFGAGT